MKTIVRLRFAMLAAALAGCVSETPETESSDAADAEEVQASQLALDLGIAGNLSGRVGRWRVDGANRCSAVFLPDHLLEAGSDSNWVLTSEGCAHDLDATYSVVSTTGVVANVDRIYKHPLADWHLGYLDGYGKVDVALAHLASTVHLDAPAMTFSFFRSERGAIEESALDDEVWGFSYDDTAGVKPDTQTKSHMMVTGVVWDYISGDQGGPIWQSAHPNGEWTLEGIHASSNFNIHSYSFAAWVMDALTCGPFDTSDIDDGFCSPDCKCGVGEGDCDSDFDCKTGLVCGSNNGALVGLPDVFDVCVEPGARQSSSASGYCASVGGCQIYEGNCNKHEECKAGLVCRPDVGYAIGESDTTNVCDLPWMPGLKEFNEDRVSTSGRCTLDEPCALGDGDCDPNNHGTCRGFLKCKANVGHHFGFDNNGVDVCVHPDFY
ncbi:hypothetical protein WMF26_48825 [Sorangium sp. So ce185]|uniref:hypothetical protein n=1 Tax=Sorangium sp. So ce185 TaxID=3133287 RepID=UPI003F5EB537